MKSTTCQYMYKRLDLRLQSKYGLHFVFMRHCLQIVDKIVYYLSLSLSATWTHMHICTETVVQN